MSAVTITEFLLARIAEDEAVARAADGPVWESGDGDVSEGGLYANHWVIAWFKLGETDPDHNFPRYSSWVRHAHENSVHAAHHDPARVLAECQAKRAIIESVDVITGDEKTYQERLAHTAAEDAAYVIARDMLRTLAAVYKDHPDYDPAWSTP